MMRCEKYNWTFKDREVVNKFDNHVRQSVPLYEVFHSQIRSYSMYYIQSNSKVVDVGCSTGHLLSDIQKNSNKKHVEYIGIDTSPQMIEFCEENHEGTFINDEALYYEFEDCSFITSVLCLQFCEKEERKQIIKSIYNGLKQDGAFVMVEKVKTNILDIHDMYNDLYYDFKRNQGLTDKEILDKNSSLRGVMKPTTLEANILMLQEVGFKKIDIFFKYNNFVGIIAVK